jgi:glycosyltransferase involved in cell wall biosynthesis
MKIAILHYHLRRGGVTTVIGHQLRALAGAADALAIAGEVPPDYAGEAAEVPGVAYDGIAPDRDPDETAQEIVDLIRERFGGPCDVLHVHNPTIRKNSRFLRILTALRERGVRLFLQIHDFAEDWRAASVYDGGEYPSDCHYGVLNSRDRGFLIDSGLKPAGVHLLFNVVPPLPGLERAERPDRIVYPVRAIRRKNLGEAMLLSLFLPGGVKTAVTLPPTNPRDLPFYELLRDFSRRRGFPVELEVGLSAPLGEVLGRARSALTTSLKEGFGFAFLEPWTAGVPVVGRRLDAVCPDFEAAGVSLPGLYDRIRVPLPLFDLGRFASAWREAIASQLRSFGRVPGEAELRARQDRMLGTGAIDFGSLDEIGQLEVCAAVSTGAGARSSLVAENPFLEGIFGEADPDLVARNRLAIGAAYSLDAYRDRLLSVYRAVVDRPIVHRIDRESLLRSFLDGGEYRLVASEAVP